MNHAIEALEVSLDVLQTNAPINEAEGNLEQAKLEREAIEDIKGGLKVLYEAVEASRIPSNSKETIN